MTASRSAAVDQTSIMTSGSFPKDHSMAPAMGQVTVDESVLEPLTLSGLPQETQNRLPGPAAAPQLPQNRDATASLRDVFELSRELGEIHPR